MKTTGRPGRISDLTRGTIRKYRNEIPLYANHGIRVVEFTEKGVNIVARSVGGVAKFGIQGVAQLGNMGLKIAEATGGFVTTAFIEIPADVVYGSLEEANDAMKAIQREIRRF